MRIRFSVKVMLCIVALFALLLTIGPRIYNWYHTAPTIPLASAISSFNAQYGDDPVGRYEPPVTEAEILASIRAQLPTLGAHTKVHAIYSDVVRSRRIPEGSRLYAMNGWQMKDGTIYTVWWINLDVPLRKNSGYGLRIRENNAPVAKPEDEPKLNSPNLVWVP
jgi:hypothetical protein